MTQPQFDAIVIGAGAGGMSAAAHLVAAGRKVLIVESQDRLGGRASSEEIDGFIVNRGAIAIERGSGFEQTFELLGVPLDVREPQPATVFRIDGKIIDPSKGGGWNLIIGGLTKAAAKIGATFGDVRKGNTELPEEALSTEEWLRKFTKNQTVHKLFRNLCAAIWAANADELPARAFLTYFSFKGAFKRFGFCPRGTIGLWNDLGDAIRARGGEIWLDTPVTRIHVEGGRATGVDVVRNGRTERVDARVVISNIGPAATVPLAGEEVLGADYVAKVRRVLRPAANIVVNFATRERLIDLPGLVTFANTERLCNMGELTAMCPEMAPPGWHLYVAYVVPKPALGDFDEKAETELGLQDLRNEFPGFKDAKMLSIRVMRGEWPAQRSCAGYDLPQETPLPNLWNVGDAVKDYGGGGTQACVDTGREAAHKALAVLGVGVPA
ncbi:phytoene desaturase family protein [Pseudacidovorax sp. NFM-22]|uniref:phytoene desaturase family protein n=1 Tax=Pseudacidovorax sp. NFM-22 TaxID=2744469 RepID=UPI001F2F699C|nr:FAD-dependent oxidoreductase [Pseudacidovorax sp. NFM-22]